MRQILSRGSGFGTAPPTWREGKRQNPPARPRDVKAAARKLVKRLKKHAHGNPDFLHIAAALQGCHRFRRCLHPACPQCGRALQRVLVRGVDGFLEKYPSLGPWMVVSIILQVLDADGDIDFAAERDRYAALLRQAGISRGVFGLDLSFNEDHRRSLPEAQRFVPYPCVHLYGLAPATQVEAAGPRLKQLVPRSPAVPRPVRVDHFDGGLAGIAYAFKPDFERRQTVEQFDPRRGKPVRNTRGRPLTVEQRIRALRALDHAGLPGRILLIGLRFEIEPLERARFTPRT